MTIATAFKARIYVGPSVRNKMLPDQTAIDAETSAFSAALYTEIAHVSDLGSIGAEGGDVAYGVIGDGFTHRLRGRVDNGTLELIAAKEVSDPGQAILRAAVQGEMQPRRFKVVLNDAPPGGSPTTFYFRGVTRAAKDALGDTTDVINTTFSIGISGMILEIPAGGDGATLLPFDPTLAPGEVGEVYTANVIASGGTGTVSYAVTAGVLPTGLSLNASTGAITGTPSVAGTGLFTITATYSTSGVVSQTYTITVAP